MWFRKPTSKNAVISQAFLILIRIFLLQYLYKLTYISSITGHRAIWMLVLDYMNFR